MKQLKVVVNQSTNTTYAQTGGYVTANFVTPIEIKKGSLICLDKFNATSKNISQNFSVVGQTFEILVNQGVYPSSSLLGPSSITVPAGIYATIQSYMNTINTLTNNNALSAWVSTEPDGDNTGTNIWSAGQSQNGLAVLLEPHDGILSKWNTINYGLSAVSTISSPFWTPSDNITIDINGLFNAIDPTLGAVIQSGPVMVGGGLSTVVILSLSDTETGSFNFGFVSTDATKLGGKLVQSIGDADLQVLDDAGEYTSIANSQTLFLGAYAGSANCRFMIYQKNGVFGFNYCNDITDDNSPVVEYCFTGTYAGKMGTYNYASQYIVEGNYPPAEDPVPAAIGEAYYTPATGGQYVPPYEKNTLTELDLSISTAAQLAVILGFNASRYYFQLEAFGGTISSIISLLPFNINQLRSAFELAIEILDIPLKTYFAQTQNSQFSGAGGRQNVVCYFTPTPSIETQGLYSFANAVHQWLEIDNNADTWLHSLSFRIFNPYDGLSFISNSMGFNLLISEPDTRGLTIGL